MAAATLPTFDQQKQALTGGTEVIVATPGKLLSHLNLGYVPPAGLEMLVLDEADRMLDMGFIDDIRRIIGFLPEDAADADVQRHDGPGDPGARARRAA